MSNLKDLKNDLYNLRDTNHYREPFQGPYTCCNLCFIVITSLETHGYDSLL
ncbi:hypothetical protein WN48_07228 [Eufriesea mexicana]|uniref:Uncharacterized protein n=1 Tax=Eufriesea mexicana TaxID=516756 RepID=A0A310SJF5_9HYME|nr:hypothetical protein WN48_07228 [Eufriesea mexicana]